MNEGDWLGPPAGEEIVKDIAALVETLEKDKREAPWDAGLGQPIDSLSGSYDVGFDWSAHTDFTVAVEPKRVVRRIGRLYLEYEGKVLGRTETFKLFNVMDRRQARRVARRLGRRFNWRGGVARWRS